VKYLCVYCGSQPGLDERYTLNARKVADAIVDAGWGLVYGGGDIGLMGVVARRVVERGGPVIGIITQQLTRLEIAYPHCTELLIVESMAIRKRLLADKAEAILALPGGYGTLDELFEALTEVQLGLHQKPIGLFNDGGFYDPLLAWIDMAEREGFLKAKYGLRPESGKPLLQTSRELEPLLASLLRPTE
jgi:uncharacterized protein (TIGR00730 family)